MFGTLSSSLTQLHLVSGVVCVVSPFAGDEKLENIHVDLALLGAYMLRWLTGQSRSHKNEIDM